MNLLRKSCVFKINFSTKPKPLVIPDERVLKSINNEEYKPRKHPGIIKPKTVTPPNEFTKAVIKATEDYPIKTLIKEGQVLSRHLSARHKPIEKQQFIKKADKAQEKILSKFENPRQFANEEEEQRFRQTLKDRTTKLLKKQVYNWKPVEYNAYNSLLYLIGRSAAEYAVLVKIMAEIAQRDPEFKPKSLFDFGSGVGTATWAAIQYWKEHIFEYYNVDASRDMNDLAAILLQGGKSTGNMMLKGVFHRQFLPASVTMYDLVICAYTLFELPNANSRLETIVNLWNKTGKYLIIVEHGTNAGYQLVNEVRDFILQINKKPNAGHVFSPCPHDEICPRFVSNDGTPCNFEVFYFDFPLGPNPPRRQELFSYVVLKKSERDKDHDNWPRVVRPTLVRSKHCICRICTANGQLDEVIFTKNKHGKPIHHCARHTEWGDRLPVTLEILNNQTEK